MSNCDMCDGVFLYDVVAVNNGSGTIGMCKQCLQKHAVKCRQCGGYILKDNVKKLGNKYYCQDCANQLYQCCNCGDYFGYDDVNEFNGEYYCQECYNNQFGGCDHCGQICPYEQLIYTYDQSGHDISVCPDCVDYYVLQCDRCGRSFDAYGLDADYIVCDDGYICSSCQQYYGVCQQCGQWFDLQDLTYIGDCWYCSDCEKETQIDPQVDDNSIVYQHGRKLKTKMKKVQGESETDQYIGVQLQIRSKEDSQQDCINFCKKASKNKNLFFKADASIGSTGIQIVTQPCTYSFHMHGMGWQRIFHYMREFKLTNTDNCGLHFHISKKNFTTDQQKCLDYFVNNATKFLSQIGGRDYSNFSDGEYCHGGKKEQEQYGDNIRDRYQAVNFKNSNTIQLRFFKSTAQFGQFRKRLGLTHNICKMAKFFTFDQVKELEQTDLKYCFHEIVQNIY